MKSYEAFKTELPTKTKATLLIENEWGFVVARKVWLLSYGAQKKEERCYALTLQARFIYKGEQKAKGLWLNKATIALGWQDVAGVISNKQPGEWTCFDNASFDQAEKQLSNIVASTKQLEELDRARTAAFMAA